MLLLLLAVAAARGTVRARGDMLLLLAVAVGYTNNVVVINWLARVMVQHARVVAGATSYC